MSAEASGSSSWTAGTEALFLAAPGADRSLAQLGRWNEWKENVKEELEAMRARVTDPVLDVVACELADLLDRMHHPHREMEAEAQRLGPRIRWRPDAESRLSPPPPVKGSRPVLLYSDELRSAPAARALEQALCARGVEPITRELYPELGVFFQALWRGIWARAAISGFDFNDVLAFDRVHNEGRLLGVVNRLAARSLSRGCGASSWTPPWW